MKKENQERLWETKNIISPTDAKCPLKDKEEKIGKIIKGTLRQDYLAKEYLGLKKNYNSDQIVSNQVKVWTEVYHCQN